jgi:uncharacterized protein YfdQ (DUF2303 family)
MPGPDPSTQQEITMSEDNQALIDAMEKYVAVESFSFAKNHSTDMQVPVLSVPEGKTLQGVKVFLDEYLQAPERHRGTSVHETLESFIEHVNLFKIEGRTSIFGTTDGSGSLVAVYDYHNRETTSFNEHGSLYNPKPSPEWVKWMAQNGSPMSQVMFAAFVEDVALDFIHPPAEAKNDGDKVLMSIARTLNAKYATPAQMMDLSRGIKVHENAQATSAYDLSTGSQTVEYNVENTAKTKEGNKLSVPGLFLIGIPVFLGGDLYRLPVRLRFRLSGGRVEWFYQLYRPEQYARDAFDHMFGKAAEETGLTVYRGKPE